jgi:prepilin-type processing-associated H-X9-DG protein
VTPFIGLSAGVNVYGEPLGSAPSGRFLYARLSDILDERDVPEGAIDSGTASVLNTVGRHHPGTKNSKGGQANFAYVDGHVEQSSIFRTIEDKRWGDRFYSISGDDRVNMLAPP